MKRDQQAAINIQDEDTPAFGLCQLHHSTGLHTQLAIAQHFRDQPALARMVTTVLQHRSDPKAKVLVLLLEGLDTVDLDFVEQSPAEPSSSAAFPGALRTALSILACPSCGAGPPPFLVMQCRDVSLLPPWILLPPSPVIVGTSNTVLASGPLIRARGTAGPGPGSGTIVMDTWLRLVADAEDRAGAGGHTTVMPHGLLPPEDPSAALTATSAFPGWAGYESLKGQLWSAIVQPYRAQAMMTAAKAGRGATSADPTLVALCESMRTMGVRPPAGLLLYGPPGTGKTAVGIAMARACGAVLLQVSCSRLLSRYVGDSEAGVRRIFAAARALQPCVLVLDGVDAIAGARAGLQGDVQGQGAGSGPSIASGTILDRLLATLLAEIDGLGQRTGGQGAGSLAEPMVLLVGTCTIAEGGQLALDTALLRPGRLELKVRIGEPEVADRLAILQAHPLLASGDLRTVPSPVKVTCDAKVLQAVAEACHGPGWRAGTLVSLVTEAALCAAEDVGTARTADEEAPGHQQALGLHHFSQAAQRLSIPLDTSLMVDT